MLSEFTALNGLADALWRDLPELVRSYPAEKRHDTRIHAYTLFDKFAGAQDEESLQRLRFVLETQQDVGREFYAPRFKS
jgi:hypothetical protein